MQLKQQHSPSILAPEGKDRRPKPGLTALPWPGLHLQCLLRPLPHRFQLSWGETWFSKWETTTGLATEGYIQHKRPPQT